MVCGSQKGSHSELLRCCCRRGRRGRIPHASLHPLAPPPSKETKPGWHADSRAKTLGHLCHLHEAAGSHQSAAACAVYICASIKKPTGKEYLHYIHTYIHTYIHAYIIHTCIHTYIFTYILSYSHTYILTYIHNCIHVYNKHSGVDRICGFERAFMRCRLLLTAQIYHVHSKMASSAISYSGNGLGCFGTFTVSTSLRERK